VWQVIQTQRETQQLLVEVCTTFYTLSGVWNLTWRRERGLEMEVQGRL
jgi:hypothetical protein